MGRQRKFKSNSDFADKLKNGFESLSNWIQEDNSESALTTVSNIITKNHNIIKKALEKGYSVEQIVEYLNKSLKDTDYSLTPSLLRNTLWRIKKNKTTNVPVKSPKKTETKTHKTVKPQSNTEKDNTGKAQLTPSSSGVDIDAKHENLSKEDIFTDLATRRAQLFGNKKTPQF